MQGHDAWRLIQEATADGVDQLVFPEIGIVESIDLDTYTVKCRLVYDDVVSAPLRIAEQYTGDGFGVTNMPDHGDEVVIVFQGGRAGDGYVVGRLYGRGHKPPGHNFGDWQFAHKSGSIFKFSKDGGIDLTSPGGDEMHMGSDGTFTLQGKEGSLLVMRPNGEAEFIGVNGGKLFLKADGSAQMEAGGRRLTLDNGAGSLKTDAGGLNSLEALVKATVLTFLQTHTHPYLNGATPATTSAPAFPTYPTGNDRTE